MRLIGEFKDERHSFGFQAFLKKEGIQSLYDSTKDASGQTTFRLWIVEEDDFDQAWAFYQEWQKDPHDVRFEPKQEKVEPVVSNGAPPKWKVRMVSRQTTSFSLNNLIILICGLIFILNSFQEGKIKEKGEAAFQLTFTPIEQKLLFDYPLYFVNLEKFLAEYPVKTMAEIKELPAEGQAAFAKAERYPYMERADSISSWNESWKDYEELPAGHSFWKDPSGGNLAPIYSCFTPWQIGCIFFLIWRGYGS